jgi:predicted amidophosphoribosyltransferase
MNLTPAQRIISNFIIDFKNGHQPASRLAAKIVAEAIKENFDIEQQETVFIPIPASNKEESYKRYNLFSFLVSQNCCIIDGHNWVKNWKETEKKHLSENHDIQYDQKRWFVDYKLVRNARVIIFDDVKTTGETANTIIQKLEECGATVIGAIFLGKTIHYKRFRKED